VADDRYQPGAADRQPHCLSSALTQANWVQPDKVERLD
jgi:hypothetical protein